MRDRRTGRTRPARIQGNEKARVEGDEDRPKLCAPETLAEELGELEGPVEGSDDGPEEGALVELGWFEARRRRGLSRRRGRRTRTARPAEMLAEELGKLEGPVDGSDGSNNDLEEGALVDLGRLEPRRQRSLSPRRRRQNQTARRCRNTGRITWRARRPGRWFRRGT
jgi:hypothetical protein